jgi:hypothetical protein
MVELYGWDRLHDEAAILDLANLPIEARIILHRQDRRRAPQDRELREHLRMNGRKRPPSTKRPFGPSTATGPFRCADSGDSD